MKLPSDDLVERTAYESSFHETNVIEWPAQHTSELNNWSQIRLIDIVLCNMPLSEEKRSRSRTARRPGPREPISQREHGVPCGSNT